VRTSVEASGGDFRSYENDTTWGFRLKLTEGPNEKDRDSVISTWQNENFGYTLYLPGLVLKLKRDTTE
jgi:hypothetical protein